MKNIETTKFFEVNNFKDLKESAKNLNYNCILKTQELVTTAKDNHDKKENLYQFENQFYRTVL